MDDFPKASQTIPETEVKPQEPEGATVEEKQLSACKKVIQKLGVNNFFGTVSLKESLQQSVIQKLEDNGFEISYTEYYKSKNGKTVNITITDPGLKSKFTEQVKKSTSAVFSGVNPSNSSEFRDGLTGLMDVFLGGQGNSNVTSFRF